MAENRKSEGKLVTVFLTAASNIDAGSMVGVSGLLAYNLSSATVGLGNTATLGYNFIGIADDDITAGRCPINVWVEGVFTLALSSASTSGLLTPGNPVWAGSGAGSGAMVILPGNTGDVCVGSLVNARQNTAVGFVDVKINPARWRWSVLNNGGTTATAGCMPLAFPQFTE
jgi:predicted RecA/RadA family phage recombinase